MAKLQLEDLLNRNMQEGFQSKDVYVKGLGGELTVIHQPLPTVLRIMDDIKQDATLSTVMDAMVQLIYACVPLFKNKELQAKWDRDTQKIIDEWKNTLGGLTVDSEVINARIDLHGIVYKGLYDLQYEL